MKKYFTSIEVNGTDFIGTVYDSTNNQVIYKTKPYKNQTQVTVDIGNFLAKSETGNQIPKPQTITNTITHQPEPTPILNRRRCCGR